MDEGADDQGLPEARPDQQPEARPEQQPEAQVEIMKLDIAADVRAAAENKYERRPLIQQKDVALSQADDVEFRAAQRVMIDPPVTATQQKTQMLVFSLLAFLLAALIGRSGWSLVELAMLVGVIFVHELGHMAGMIAFGYKDVRIFFIPFLGGAAMGKKHGVPKWKEAIVLLLGPLPGIVAGLLLMKVFGATGRVHTLAWQLIAVNALNLLPVHPLDGGRLFSVLLFSRNRHLELVFTGVTCALLGVAALFTGMWFIAIVVYFILSNLTYTKRMMEAGHRLRDAGLPANPAQLSEQQQKRLWRETWDALPDGKRTRWRGQPFAQARAMEEVLERATMRPPSVEATIFILLVWLGGMVAAGVGSMPEPTPPPAWATFHFASPAFAVDLQGAPRVEQGRGRTQITAGRCQITFAPIVEDEATWIARAGATAPNAKTAKKAFARDGIGFLVVGEQRCLDSFKLE